MCGGGGSGGGPEGGGGSTSNTSLDDGMGNFDQSLGASGPQAQGDDGGNNFSLSSTNNISLDDGMGNYDLSMGVSGGLAGGDGGGGLSMGTPISSPSPSLDDGMGNFDQQLGVSGGLSGGDGGGTFAAATPGSNRSLAFSGSTPSTGSLSLGTGGFAPESTLSDVDLSFGEALSGQAPTPRTEAMPYSLGNPIDDPASDPDRNSELGLSFGSFEDDFLDNLPHGARPSAYQEDAVREAARRAGVPEADLLALVGQESAYRDDVWDMSRRSTAGAIGPGQLMPGTAAELGVDPYDVEQNLAGAAEYYGQQLDRFDNRRDLALAAYNAGPNRQSLREGRVPNIEETRNYVENIQLALGGDPLTSRGDPLAREGYPAPPRQSTASYPGGLPDRASQPPPARDDAAIAAAALRSRGNYVGQPRAGIAGMLGGGMFGGMGQGRQTGTYQNMDPVEKGILAVTNQFLPGAGLIQGIGFAGNDRELNAAADMLEGTYEPRKGLDIFGMNIGADPEFSRVEPVVNDLTGETVGAMGYNEQGEPVMYRGQRQGVRYSGPGEDMVNVPSPIDQSDGRWVQSDGDGGAFSQPFGGTQDSAAGDGEPAEDPYVPNLPPWAQDPLLPSPMVPDFAYTQVGNMGVRPLLPYPRGRPGTLSRLEI